jgi:hypothetical protein
MTFADDSASSAAVGLPGVTPGGRSGRGAAPTDDRRPTDDAARRDRPAGGWR